MIEKIQDILIQRGQTLSVAESCTGGSLSAMITKIPGCSVYFLGGVISYSNQLKIKLLNVDPRILDKVGAVSKEVAMQMAEGVLQLTGSHFSIAVSGIVGPSGGTREKPVGTIWGAIASHHSGTEAWKFELQGSRAEIIEQTCHLILNKFLGKLN